MSEFSLSGDELPSQSIEKKPDDVTPGGALPASDISQQFDISLVALRNLTNCLVHQPKANLQPDILISKSLEKYSRLKTWGEETRAALPANSRGSLDHSIRKDIVLKEMVKSILEKIERQTVNAIHTTQSLPKEHTSDSDSNEDTDSSSGSEDDEWTINAGESSKKPAMWRTLQQIEEDIRSLFQISLLIKRPGFTRQYVHSTNQTSWDLRVAHYVEFDRHHVEEKLLDWNRAPTRQDEEEIATPESLSQRVSISGSLASLTERLARANTKRREQLFYWSKHPDHNPAAVDSDARTMEGKSIRNPEESKGTGKKKLARKGEDGENKSEYAKSMMSKQTFSTAVVSDKLGALTVAGPARTVYAESTTGRRMSNRVPSAPSTSLRHKTFECPYCHLDLDSVLMRRRQEWKRHVFRDLRPYVCTFLDCQTPDKQYQSRHDWIYHETQMHRRKWVCEEHGSDFSTTDDFVGHLSTAHASTVTQQQIPTLLEISERPCDEMEVFRCPLCPDARKLSTLRTHLAMHLESISLFALSGTTGIEEDDFVDEDKKENTDSDAAAGGTQSSASSVSNGSGIIEQEPEESEEILALKRNLGVSNLRLSVTFHHILRSLQARRAPGTFEWILEHPSFKLWLGPGKPNIAWLFGTEKSGKSTMASFIAAHIVHTRGLCVYYPTRAVHHLVGSLETRLRLMSILTAQQSPHFLRALNIPDKPLPTFLFGHTSTEAASIVWQRIYQDTLFNTSSNKTIYWIIDDVEEMRPLELFLSLLVEIDASKTPIKVLLVSSCSPEVERAFEVVSDVVPLFMLKA